jgi:hypothetical protein
MATPGKSLLRTLEDDRAMLERRTAALQAEIASMSKRFAVQEKQYAAAVARADEAAAAADEAVHSLRLEQANTLTLQRTNKQLAEELRVERMESQARAAGLERVDRKLAESVEQSMQARQGAEELKTAVRARDAAVSFESTRGAALEGGVHALAARLRAVEATNEARVAEWLAERRRLQEALTPSPFRPPDSAASLTAVRSRLTGRAAALKRGKHGAAARARCPACPRHPPSGAA